MPKQSCHFCGKKFKPQGLWRHERSCTKRVVDPNPPTDVSVNTAAPRPQSPFMQLSNSLFKFHEELQEKLHDLAGLFRY